MIFDAVKFRALVSGDQELAFELLKLFESDRVLLLRQVIEGAEQGLVDQVEKAAHRLKGNLRNFYAESPAALAGQIEEWARQGELKGVPEVLRRLEPELDQLIHDLKVFIQTEMS